MNLSLNNIGKKYSHEWIFRNITLTFNENKSYAVLGPNGSGKSTLMRIISGYLTPSEGTRTYQKNHHEIHIDEVYQDITYAAPYIELIDEFSLQEQIEFHLRFKSFLDDMQPDEVIDILNFHQHKNKEIANFSSGMKQRLKLALAILTRSRMLLLDEPNTNLDEEGVLWYRSLIEKYGAGRLIIVASNRLDEYEFCEEHLVVSNYK